MWNVLALADEVRGLLLISGREAKSGYRHQSSDIYCDVYAIVDGPNSTD